MRRDDEVAAMLEAGATHQEIKRQLHVGDGTIVRVRRERRILLPPGRAKRSRAELNALVPQAVAMLRSGATVKEIRALTLLSLNEIARLRREHRIPLPQRDHHASMRRTVDDAFALYAKPTLTGGHLLWTGPRSGRGVDLIASGRKHNARAVAFRKHHGRDPEGRLRRTCDQPGCIAGAHHTDRTLRQQLRSSR